MAYFARTFTVEDLKKVIEAVLFAAGRVVTLKDLKALFPENDPEDIKEALRQLKKDYEKRGVVLKEVAGGFRLETLPEFAPYIQRIKQGAPPRLSRAALETLAVIAYKQPLTKAEIEVLRGVDSSGALKTLLEKGLIKIAGRKDVPGRPLLYATTSRFLEVFGLKDLSELPPLKEFEKLLEEK